MSDIREFTKEINELLMKYKDQPVATLIGLLEGAQFYLLHEGLVK